MKNPKDKEDNGVSGVASSDMLDVTMSIELEEIEAGKADLVLMDKGFYCSMTVTTRQAQELANRLQRWVDSECKGKSPELHDAELAAHHAAVQQWNAAQTVKKAADDLKKKVEGFLSI
jgi:hypothetical protein